MKLRVIKLIVLGFIALLCHTQAEEYKPGPAYPKDRKSGADLPLGSFMNQRRHLTDWSLVVLIRGEQDFILNKKENRHLAAKPGVEGDIIMTDEDATSFLGWRRQNPGAMVNIFWEANPQLLTKAIRYSSDPTSGSSSLPDGGHQKDDRPNMDDTATNLTLSNSKQAIPHSKPITPSKEPAATSTLLGGGALLITTVIGLLWLVLKKRK